MMPERLQIGDIVVAQSEAEMAAGPQYTRYLVVGRHSVDITKAVKGRYHCIETGRLERERFGASLNQRVAAFGRCPFEHLSGYIDPHCQIDPGPLADLGEKSACAGSDLQHAT